MADFSSTDAALEGFRIGRENPGGLVVWTVLYFAASLLSAVLMIRNGSADILAALSATPQTAPPDPAQLMAEWERAVPGMMASYPPLIAAQLLIQAAVLRVIIRPEGARAYLRLGGDELRVLGAFLIILVLTAGGAFLAVLAGQVLGPAGVLLAMLASLGLSVFFSTRLSLLYPQAVAERSLNVRSAWDLTRGRFWKVFGTLFMATVFFLIVLLLGSVVSYAIRTIGGIDAGPATSMADLMSPAMLAARFVESLLQALGLVLLSAPAAVIYRSLRVRP